MPASSPRLYADACIFLNVLLQETGRWRPSLKILRAAQRGDVRLVASRLLAVEVGRWRAGQERLDVDGFVLGYLEQVAVEWAEVDLLVAREARRLSWDHKLRTADATHLATAVRLDCDYFMSNDGDFPHGSTLGRTQVTEPTTVWDPTTEDHEIDLIEEP